MPFSPSVARHILMHGMPQVMVIYRDLDQEMTAEDFDSDYPTAARGHVLGGYLTPIGSPMPNVGDCCLVKLPDGSLVRYQVVERTVPPGLHGQDGDCAAVELSCRRADVIEAPHTNGVAQEVPA